MCFVTRAVWLLVLAPDIHPAEKMFGSICERWVAESHV